MKQFEQLIQALSNVGLATEVRNGDADYVLVFVKVASQHHLHGEVFRSRYVRITRVGFQHPALLYRTRP